VELKHPVDKAMDDFWLDQQTSQSRAKKVKAGSKPLYHGNKRKKTCLSMRMLDNACRIACGRRLHQTRLTKARIAQLIDIVTSGRLTAYILLQQFWFINLWWDEASEQHAAFCFLASHGALRRRRFARMPSGAHSMYEP
jgi:hypothetical protein